MKMLHPARLVGLILAIMGSVFLVMGGIFVAVKAELLPELFISGGGELPDALALPLIGLIFAAIGAMFAAVGVILIQVSRRQERLREELERFGMRVQGKVTDIRIDHTYRVNGRSPLRVVVQAQHPFSGEIRTMRSAPVWETTLATDDSVDVLLDPQDEKKCVVILPE